MTAITGAGGEEWQTMDETAGYPRATWQGEINRAKAAIPALRQRDCLLTLRDRQGNPVAGREVEIVQHSSPFLWGEQLWGQDRFSREGSWDHDQHSAQRRLFADCFTACNALHYWTERPRNDGPKSEEFQGYPQYDHLQRCVDWGNANGLVVKGHPLFWSIPKAVPDWVQAYPLATRKVFLEARIRSICSRFRGKIALYDVVNEPIWEPTFANITKRHWPHLSDLGELADMIAEVQAWAREEDPDAQYIVNDYGVLARDETPVQVPASDGSTVTAESQLVRYEGLFRALRERSALPDAIGLQSHTGGWGQFDKVTETWQRLAEASGGLPIHITEFWAHTKHLEQAGLPEREIQDRLSEYLEDMMTVAFGSKQVESFFFWGTFGQMVKTLPGGGWEPTPVYERLRGLIRGRWRTKVQGRTDVQGQLHWRGFHGGHVVRLAQASGQRSGVHFDLAAGNGSAAVDVVVPFAAS